MYLAVLGCLRDRTSIGIQLEIIAGRLTVFCIPAVRGTIGIVPLLIDFPVDHPAFESIAASGKSQGGSRSGSGIGPIRHGRCYRSGRIGFCLMIMDHELLLLPDRVHADDTAGRSGLGHFGSVAVQVIGISGRQLSIGQFDPGGAGRRIRVPHVLVIPVGLPARKDIAGFGHIQLGDRLQGCAGPIRDQRTDPRRIGRFTGIIDDHELACQLAGGIAVHGSFGIVGDPLASDRVPRDGACRTGVQLDSPCRIIVFGFDHIALDRQGPAVGKDSAADGTVDPAFRDRDLADRGASSFVQSHTVTAGCLDIHI